MPAHRVKLRNLERWLLRDERNLPEFRRNEVEKGLSISLPLRTAYVMRRELAALWARSMASQEQLVRQLQDWCRRAETSGIRPLMEFSHQLRRYA